MDENIQQTEPQFSHCWALYDTIRLPSIKDTDTLRVEEPEMTPKSKGTHGALQDTIHHHHHHHQSLNREGRWGTTDDFATSFLVKTIA